MKHPTFIWTSIALFLLQIPSLVLAEDGDIMLGNLELDKVLNLCSGLLATVLFLLIVLAYTRNKNKRLLYVGAAFLLFAIKSLLLSIEIGLGDWPWVDIVASTLDFVILLTFFCGIIRK